MSDNNESKIDELVDFITGKKIPDVGCERNRQMVEQVLVNEKKFNPQDIIVDMPVNIIVAGEAYNSSIDLVICIDDIKYIAIKCAAGSLGSREKEIIAASRVAGQYQIPYSVISDGKTAIVIDTVSGSTIGDGFDFFPSKQKIQKLTGNIELIPYPKEKVEREKIIFRSYDSMNVNKMK